MNSIPAFDAFASKLDPCIGTRGGRYFRHKITKQLFRMNEIVARFQKGQDASPTVKIKGVMKIMDLEAWANELVAKQSTLIKILTWIRQFFGNLFSNRNRVLDTIKKEYLDSKPPSDKEISSRIVKNLQFAYNQGFLEKHKGFCLFQNIYENIVQGETVQIGAREIGISYSKGILQKMEDRHLATSLTFEVQGVSYQAEIYGIFDGHDGFEAAEFACQNIEEALKNTMSKQSSLDDGTIWKVLKETFKQLDEDFTQSTSGTTAAIALILNGKLWIANVGDSRIILNTNEGKTIQLTEDANPNIERYRRQIVKKGGFYRIDASGEYRVSGLLNMARAIGDKSLGKAISPLPKITHLSLSAIKEGILILACDGMTEVASSAEIGKAIESMKGTESPEMMAKKLVYSAIKNDSGDNVSVIVVKV